MSFADIGEVKEFFFSSFDLGHGIRIDVFLGGFVDNLKTGGNQLAAEVFVIYELGIVFGIGERRRTVGQFDQIFISADFFKNPFLFKIVFQRNDVGNMAAGDEFGNNLINLAMDRIGKMLGFQKFRNFFKGFVIGQQGAEQRLFRFDILGQLRDFEIFHSPGVLSFLLLFLINKFFAKDKENRRKIFMPCGLWGLWG